ncbi:MAG: TRAP transporter small permease, partial [Bdellovibrionales bacterium]|nr:TRAP transporter small permease [Ramlibacter sp.]
HLVEEPGHRIETIVSGPTLIEHASEAVSSIALVAMIILIGAEAIVRNVFSGSLQITSEIGGYLLVAVTFLSMSVAEAHGGFHRVELVQARMSQRARIKLQILFDGFSLAACLLIAWQLWRLARNSWNSGDVAPTPLQTPLWLPQIVMGIGMSFLCLALLRSAYAKWTYLSSRVAT